MSRLRNVFFSSSLICLQMISSLNTQAAITSRIGLTNSPIYDDVLDAQDFDGTIKEFSVHSTFPLYNGQTALLIGLNSMYQTDIKSVDLSAGPILRSTIAGNITSFYTFLDYNNTDSTLEASQIVAGLETYTTQDLYAQLNLYYPLDRDDYLSAYGETFKKSAGGNILLRQDFEADYDNTIHIGAGFTYYNTDNTDDISLIQAEIGFSNNTIFHKTFTVKTAFDFSGKGYYGLGCEFALSKSQAKVNSNIEVLDGKFMTVKKSHVDLNNLGVPKTNTVVYRSAVPPTPQPTASASAN